MNRGTVVAAGLAAAAITGALPAPAQTPALEDEGRGLTVTEQPLPSTYYRERLMARYAAPGRCDTDRVEDLVVLTGAAVQIGPVLCEGLGKPTWEDDRLVLPLSACRIEQEEVDDRTLTLARLTGGDLSIRSTGDPSHVPNEVMERCGG